MGAIFVVLPMLCGMCLYPVAAVIYLKLFKRSSKSIRAIMAEL